jgi:hypothetical protein
MDLLTTCIPHYTLLQVITALSLISILYKLPQNSLNLFQPAASRSLAKASNSGSSASRAQVFLSQSPIQNSCQLSTQIWRHFFSAFLAELNLTANTQLNGLSHFSSLQPLCTATSESPFLYCCLRIRFRGNVFTESLLRKCHLFIRLLHSKKLYALFVSRSLPNNGSTRHNILK